MKLENIDINKLLPLFMQEKGNEDVQAMSQVLSRNLQDLARQISKLSTWDSLKDLNSEELDSLAGELSIYWYDKSLTDDQKRVLIAQSDMIHMKLGTKRAILNVVKDVFGPALVEEWFEYDGAPNYFRIMVSDAATLTAENEARLMRILEYVKRKSQWLESIQSLILADLPLNMGMSVGIHTVVEVMFDRWVDHVSGSKAYLGLASVARTIGEEQDCLNLNIG